MQSLFFSIFTVFSVTRSFRNHSNRPIWCLVIIGAQLWIIVLIIISFEKIIFADFVIFLGGDFWWKEGSWNSIYLKQNIFVKSSTFILI